MNFSRNRNKFGFLVLSIFFITGCNTLGPEIQRPLPAQVEGEKWVADEIAYQRPITIIGNERTIIYGISSTDGRIALFTTEPVASTGTYKIKDTESDTSLS